MTQWTVCLVVAGTMMFGHSQVPAEESIESIIESNYSAWVKATNAKDIESWASYLAPNALFVPPVVPELNTREAILDYYRQAFADPNFALDCRQVSVDVAQSGEMAWAHGFCQATFTGSAGQKSNGRSRWFKVWLKQPDGSWKCAINTWNYLDEQGV